MILQAHAYSVVRGTSQSPDKWQSLLFLPATVPFCIIRAQEELGATALQTAHDFATFTNAWKF